MPPWLLPVLGGVIAVFVVAIAVLLVTGDDDEDDTDLVGGGGDTEEPDAPDGDDTGTDDGDGTEEPQYDPERLTGTWEGSYDCGDGDTDLVLTVDDYPDETGVAANWWSDPDGDDEGMYFMEGTYEGGQLALEPTGWDEPYEDNSESDMHGLEADLSGFTGSEAIEAVVDGEGCGDLTLERTSQVPWWAGSFEGSYLCAQGMTGTSITIEPTGQDTATAFFEFYDIDESDVNVPYGSMYMDGVYAERSMRLTMTSWERQPDGYVALDIVSPPDIGIHPDRFSGYLDDEALMDEGPGASGCGLIGLDRVSETEAADAAEEEAAGGSGSDDAGGSDEGSETDS